MKKDEIKELEKATTKARYEYYKKNRINFSKSSEEILEKIKNGYIPNEKDVFELLTTEEEKINQYKKFYDIKDSISKNGTIDKENLDFLIKQLNLDEQTTNMLIQLFEAKGKIK